MLDIKDTVTQIKEVFDGINSRLNKANEFKDRPLETFQTEMQKRINTNFFPQSLPICR